MFVRAKMTAPASRSRATCSASSVTAGRCSLLRLPEVFFWPAKAWLSLMTVGDAVQRRERSPVAPALFAGARHGPRELAVDEAERVQPRLHTLCPGEARVQHLDGRELAAAEMTGELDRGQERDVAHMAPRMTSGECSGQARFGNAASALRFRP